MNTCKKVCSVMIIVYASLGDYEKVSLQTNKNHISIITSIGYGVMAYRKATIVSNAFLPIEGLDMQ